MLVLRPRHHPAMFRFISNSLPLNIMMIMKTNPKVDFYFQKAKAWQQEIETLRNLVLETVLAEELKWGVPCYTLEGKNVVLIHTFKHYCALLFHKGALMDDPKGVLIQQTEHVQAARQLRFTSLAEITRQKAAIRAYIQQAIAIEQAGLKVPMKETRAFEMPEEFERKMAEQPALKAAFRALTPGRQRGYLLYFSSAKQAKTREARVDKYVPKIMEGLGLDD